jgi:hypothetical protein
MHSTNNLNDGYLGSGKRLTRSIRKYGKENFKLDILEFLPDRKTLELKEKELVNEEQLKDPLCMNICVGGQGGFISIEGCTKGGVIAAKIHVDRIKNDSEYREKHILRFSEKVKKLWRDGVLKQHDFRGGKRKEETKRKISETNKIKQKGILNSQFGTRWITDGSENKKIKNTETIPNGWVLGRKMKK